MYLRYKNIAKEIFFFLTERKRLQQQNLPTANVRRTFNNLEKDAPAAHEGDVKGKSLTWS